MSTRSHITFHESKPTVNNLEKTARVILYRHSDGYPGTADGKEYGVLSELVPFLTDFQAKRGLDDWQYASARCMQALTNESDRSMAEVLKSHEDQKASWQYTGYGISDQFHADIEFVYAVHATGLVVFEVIWGSWKANTPNTYKIIKEITI